MKKGLLQLFVLALVAVSAPLLLFGQTAAELQNKISQQNKAITDIEREIASYQNQLTVLGGQKNTLANALKILSIESQKLAADIRLTQGKINETNLKLSSLGSSIAQATANIEDLSTAVGKSLREMNAQDNESLVETLASGGTLADLWHYAGESLTFRKALAQKTNDLTATKTVLISNKTEVEKTKSQLVVLESQLEDQRSINQRTQAQKNALLKSTKNQEAAYQKLVAQKQAQKVQLENDLRNYESRLKYVLNPSALPPVGSSPFGWPLDKVVITQLFGKTSASARLYVTGSHNGVDFGIPVGTPARALASGVVIGSGNSDLACPGASYGNWILIKYDNGLSAVFGHLSLVKAATGSRVSTGEIVAYTGATGYATGPHLHVSVWPSDAVNITSFPSKACPGRTITIPTAATNAYLDPMLYFPKR